MNGRPGRKRPLRAKYSYRRIPYAESALSNALDVRIPARLSWGLFAVVALALVANLVLGEGGVLHGNKLRGELESQRTRNTQLTREHARLIQEMDFWRNDPFGVEKISRERYGMAGGDEIIFRFEDDGVVPPAPTDPDPESLDPRGGG